MISSNYLAYCKANGQTDPEVMLALDREKWPGGVMCGYILWFDAKNLEFQKKYNLRNISEVRLFKYLNPTLWPEFLSNETEASPKLLEETSTREV